jgi:cbb3-type cytochrome oxidase cytochrome c subunit
VALRAGEWIVLGGSVLIAAFAALVGVLIYLKPPPVEYADLDSAAARAGEAVFRREGCGSCHQVFGNGATYGPPLDGVGSRRTRDWLHAYMRDPRPGISARTYRARMPSYAGLEGKEMDALLAYLLALRSPGAAAAGKPH